MKVTVKHIDSGLEPQDKKMYNDFIKFINSKYPVNKELKILEAIVGTTADTHSILYSLSSVG